MDKVFDMFNKCLGGGDAMARLAPAADSPHAPSIHEQTFIIDYAMQFIKPLPALPWYVWHMCANRDLFEGVALTKFPETLETAFLFLYAKKKPYEAEFLQLVRCPTVSRHRQPGDPWERVYLYNFTWWPIRHLSAHELPISEEDDLFVLHGMTLTARHARTSCRPVPFDEFILHHPNHSKPREQRARKRPSLVAEGDITKILLDHPWLTEKDFKPGGFDADLRVAKRQRRKTHAPDRIRAAGAYDAEDDVESEHSDGGGSAFDQDELDALREAWEFVDGAGLFFYVRVLAGKWTKATKGVLADGCTALARSSACKWCDVYDMSKQMGFYYKKWQREPAHKLAEEYCRLAHHFITIYFDQFPHADAKHFPSYDYTVDELKSYEPDPVFLEWLGAQSDFVVSRGRLILDTVPTNPRKK
jgi:hypothetical protein